MTWPQDPERQPDAEQDGAPPMRFAPPGAQAAGSRWQAPEWAPPQEPGYALPGDYELPPEAAISAQAPQQAQLVPTGWQQPQQSWQQPQQSWQQPHQGWQQPGVGQQAWQQQPPRRSALVPAPIPMHGQAYVQALRPLSKRVGRWFAAGLVAVAFFMLGQIVAGLVMLPAIIGAFSSMSLEQMQSPDATFDLISRLAGDPLFFLGTNLSWAIMIPGAMVAMSVYGERSGGLVASVTGHWRWRVVARSLLVIAPVFAIYIGASFALDPTMTWELRPDWLLLALVLVTTPLQSAGEEFTFRGVMSQQIGGWIPSPVVASLVAGAVTGTIFGLAHGHTAISATLQLALVGFTCSMLAWRTGGLEASVVLHACNNVFIMAPLALMGQSALGTGEGAEADDWLGFGITVVALGIAYGLVHLTMRRIERRTTGVPGAAALVRQPTLA